jgi:hypothetical protein
VPKKEKLSLEKYYQESFFNIKTCPQKVFPIENISHNISASFEETYGRCTENVLRTGLNRHVTGGHPVVDSGRR